MRPIVAEHIETLTPYVPGKNLDEAQRSYGITDMVKLASNENPLGPSPLAVAALEAAARRSHWYPDGASHALIAKLSEFLGFKEEEIFVGSGSNEIIELLIRTFMSPTDEALLSRGSFLIYKVALQAHGRAFVEVPMRSGLRYDLEAMAARIRPGVTRLVFLANPDNPTGTAFSGAELEAFMAKVPPDCLVALDEAYCEFVDWPDFPDGLAFARRWENLAVLRTFSKMYGLAGVRLGYGVMRPEWVAYLNRTKMPFNVSALAQAAGIAAVDDHAHVRATREVVREGIAYLERELPRLGIRGPKSHANFVFADLGRPAAPIYEALLRRGLITRPIPAYGFPNALRISVGLPAQNERLVKALREVME